jgi:2TM domain
MTDQQLTLAGQDLRDRAVARLKQKRDFGDHLFVYLVVNAFLIGIWAFTGAGFFRPAFPLFLWGIGLDTAASTCPIRDPAWNGGA